MIRWFLSFMVGLWKFVGFGVTAAILIIFPGEWMVRNIESAFVPVMVMAVLYYGFLMYLFESIDKVMYGKPASPQKPNLP